MSNVVSNSRTKNSIRNSMAAIFYYIVNLLLNFISRKVFLDYLGSEVLGLNTTASNLLQFLNLAELGIGFAVSFSLYKPLAENDKQAINEIISLQGILYRRIALIIIAGAIVLSFFFPLIFRKMTLPLWYAYASFAVLLFSSLLSYFVNYKQILLSANQQEYKITLSYKLCMLIKVIVQIAVVTLLKNGYVWWLATEVAFSTISSVVLNIVIRRNHPYLTNIKQSYSALSEKFPQIVIKVKQLFFHKIAAFAVTQTSPLIIYAFLNLTVVAYYGNYLLITSGLTLLLTSIFNGVGASVGNLIAGEDKSQVIKVFNELFCFRFLLSSSLCICFFFLADAFVSLWIGYEYLLPRTTVFLMTINMYFSISRGVVDTFLNGYGLFRDIWAPVAEAIINIGGSIVGGSIWGLNGIIAGAILSQIVIIFLWKPYFLFKYGIQTNINIYTFTYLKCLISGLIGCSSIFFINSIIGFSPFASHYSFISIGILYLFLSLIIIGGIEYVLIKGMRDFVVRFRNIIKR